MTIIVLFFVSFIASIVGAICGIGGGVVIKPTLDAFKIYDVTIISFLSGCTVLAMSSFSILRITLEKQSKIKFKTVIPFSIGAVLGGIIGKNLFQIVKNSFNDPEKIGLVQSICMFFITLSTFIYVLMKGKIKTHRVTNKAICILIGLFLGILSSFLGIGGGPINLIILTFIFSMDTKTAAQNSLFIILLSQLSSLITTIVTGNIPNFEILGLIVMVIAGVFGGNIGHILNKKMDNSTVDKLFSIFIVIIILISIYNIYDFAFIL